MRFSRRKHGTEHYLDEFPFTPGESSPVGLEPPPNSWRTKIVQYTYPGEKVSDLIPQNCASGKFFQGQIDANGIDCLNEIVTSIYVGG